MTDQVREHLRSRIVDNEFVDGRIPSETDLAEALGVSRTTVRDALSRLEIEGVVYRKQGSGTFVNRPGLRIKSRLDEIWSYEEMLKAHGYSPSVKVLNVGTRTVGSATAEALHLSSSEKILEVEKLFLEDQQPVILVRNSIPLRLVSPSYLEGDFEMPVFEFLEKFAGQHLNYYLSELAPVLADEKLVKTLGLKAPAPLISIEEIGYNDLNEPIIKACSYFRDDLVRLRLMRRKI